MARGLEFTVLIVTVSGALATVPSCTITCAVYLPGLSRRNAGWTALGSLRLAVLPAGLSFNVHTKLRLSPSTSLAPLPSRVMVMPTVPL